MNGDGTFRCPPPRFCAALVRRTRRTASLLGKGDHLFKSGDLSTARQFYEQAYVEGLGRRRLGLAQSYDPPCSAALKVQGRKADTRRRRNGMSGRQCRKPEAQAAIVRLRLKPR